MTIDQINSWISLTAIAVEVKTEIEDFQKGRISKGLQLALINRLKVITSIAAFSILLLTVTVNAFYLLIKRDLSLFQFSKIVTMNLIGNMSVILSGIFALPLPELILQQNFLGIHVALTDKTMPYSLTGLKSYSDRQVEKFIWKLAKQTRDNLLENGLLSVESLEACDSAEIHLLMRATVLNMLKQLEFKQEDIFGIKNKETTFHLSTKKSTHLPKKIRDLGPALKSALQQFNTLSDLQIHVLEESLLKDEATLSAATKAARLALSPAETTQTTLLFREIGTLVHVIIDNLLNGRQDIRYAKKAQELFSYDPTSVPLAAEVSP